MFNKPGFIRLLRTLLFFLCSSNPSWNSVAQLSKYIQDLTTYHHPHCHYTVQSMVAGQIYHHSEICYHSQFYHHSSPGLCAVASDRALWFHPCFIPPPIFPQHSRQSDSYKTRSDCFSPKFNTLQWISICLKVKSNVLARMVAHACNPSTLGGRGGQITRGQEFKTSLGNMAKCCLY